MTQLERALSDLPVPVAEALGLVLEDARVCLGEDLVSAALFGSAAEGRLRPTSDVNLLLVLRRFEPAALDGLRESLRAAEAAVRLAPMIVLEGELPAVAEAFAAKFSDVRRRHRRLLGPDLLSGLAIPRTAQVRRLRQALLNLVVRLRAAYALRSLREEQLALALAGTAGPLRAAAALLLELEGRPPLPPREALATVAKELPAPGVGDALERLSEAREARRLPAGTARPTFLRLLLLAEALRERALALAE